MALRLIIALLAAALPAAAQTAGEVGVVDTGPQVEKSTRAGHVGHRQEKRQISLVCGETRYAFQYRACVDPAHGDESPGSEGTLGMPAPSNCNWYHGGFLFVNVNGKDATGYRLSDMRVIERGARGAFQMVWEHPDAQVGARFLMLPGADHVLAEIGWKARPGHEVRSIDLVLRCYPSYFTSYNKRKGDRHVATPRIDRREGEKLDVEPAADGWLCYYDTLFDTAKGEGEGPCALAMVPQGIRSGSVDIGDYAVNTRLSLDPAAGRVRMAFYDFRGKSNSEVLAVLKARGAADRARLAGLDFRPLAVQQLQLEAFAGEVRALLGKAGEDAPKYRRQVDDLLARVTELKAKADARDWQAEAELGTALMDAHDLIWNLKIAALLNG